MALRRSVSPEYPPPRSDRRAPGVQRASVVDGRLNAARGILMGLALALPLWAILTALIWKALF